MIRLTNVCKSYNGKPVLQNLTCSFPDGSITAVMAPSGTGKTTLLRLLLELEQPDSGTISGIPARKSALFQENRLCSNLSVLANVRMAGKNSSTIELLTRLGLQDSLHKPTSQLSGGMARRAALARALLHDSDILVLDEPFTGLDEENRRLAAEAIRRYRNGRTTVFVTHRQEDAELLGAERVLTLSGIS